MPFGPTKEQTRFLYVVFCVGLIASAALLASALMGIGYIAYRGVSAIVGG